MKAGINFKKFIGIFASGHKPESNTTDVKKS
jgi:hypothetical protein